MSNTNRMKCCSTDLDTLGIEISIPADAKIAPGPGRMEFYTPHSQILIGVGKDHTADLIIDNEALEALRSGEEIHFFTK